MLNDQRARTSRGDDIHQDHDHDHDEQIRDIHALTPPHRPDRQITPPPPSSSSMFMASDQGASMENFTSMSREFNALVVAGSVMGNNGSHFDGTTTNLSRIGEEEMNGEEMNPFAIVTDNYGRSGSVPFPRDTFSSSSSALRGQREVVVSAQRVRREEVETKISAWQTAKIAKINNRFKREDSEIVGWEGEKVQKANSWMKKVERKLEEKRGKALEKMQNEVAEAHRKAEERRASAEAKRGTKVAKVLEIANLMRAIGRPPAKKSFF